MGWPCLGQAEFEMQPRLVTDSQDSAEEVVGTLGQECHVRTRPGDSGCRDRRGRAERELRETLYVAKPATWTGRSWKRGCVARGWSDAAHLSKGRGAQFLHEPNTAVPLLILRGTGPAGGLRTMGKVGPAAGTGERMDPDM